MKLLDGLASFREGVDITASSSSSEITIARCRLRPVAIYSTRTNECECSMLASSERGNVTSARNCELRAGEAFGGNYRDALVDRGRDCLVPRSKRSLPLLRQLIGCIERCRFSPFVGAFQALQIGQMALTGIVKLNPHS